MAKPRSPILGYNHNVRYRGLVFHVQTEDSGITNPHVFTHLFHGGVILQTRKLVYDAGASEEAVKALMQAQHKAVLKDLRRGMFDDKMDLYLGGTPGLLPRGQGVDVEAPVAEVAPGTPPPLAPLDEPVPVTVSFEPTPATLSVPDERTARESTPPATRAPTPLPTAASIAIPPPGRSSAQRMAVNPDSLEARAPTERFPPSKTPAPVPGPAQSMTPPPLSTRDSQRRNVSDAFNAIIVEEAQQAPAGGGIVEVAEDDVPAEIHSAAPGSAPPLPGGERPGAYVQHRRRDSGNMPAIAPDMPTTPSTKPSAPSIPTTPPRGHAPPVPARAPGPLARPPTPMATAKPAGPPPVAQGRTAPPLPTYPSGRPASPAPPTGRAGVSRTRSPSTGGVVVTRPAVIIGAPARTVGATTPPTQQAQQPAPSGQSIHPATTPTKSTAKVRKAREDSDSGIFGQDLISEKSLDEVILAYLSEDSSDD